MANFKKILFITLSNIGDVILTLPVLDSLKEKFPGAKITVLTAERPREIFENNPVIDKVIVFDKHARLREKIKLFIQLKKENFNKTIDLRFKVAPFRIMPGRIIHMKAKHLYSAGVNEAAIERKSIYISQADQEHVNRLLKEHGIEDSDRIIVIASGARSQIKRWPKEKFAELVHKLGEEFKTKIILVGDKDDAAAVEYIAKHSTHPVIDLSAQTNITQLACLLKKSCLVITNDSACLHLASYLNLAVLAIFGPTNELRYGPWSANSRVVKKDIFCRPCEKARCKYSHLKCMQLIKADDVLGEARKILASGSLGCNVSMRKEDFRRILIVRTDRIGDVLLSTPVIKAIREAYVSAYIAMMVSPYAREIVEGNPFLDEVIIYDKDCKHKGLVSSIKFARKLKEMKFDLALILHPINRVHLITFFANIKRRIGYDRKFGFLLTDKIKHTKQMGQKHESEYSLDFVRYLGIEPKDKKLFMPIKSESEKQIDELFRQENITPEDKLLCIHPSASCPSKVWPVDRFAGVADKLSEKRGFKVLVVSGARDTKLAENLINQLKHKGINLSGKTSISQLASLLKRCELFISNDSGPVHIASAVGTPVISIFGRNQKGLSPKRWGPLGLKDRILHKDAGCIECLAHNCVKEFACLKAITEEDVLSAADSILNEKQ